MQNLLAPTLITDEYLTSMVKSVLPKDGVLQFAWLSLTCKVKNFTMPLDSQYNKSLYESSFVEIQDIIKV